MRTKTLLLVALVLLTAIMASGCTDPSDNSFIAAGRAAGDALEDSGAIEDSNGDVLFKIGPITFTE